MPRKPAPLSATNGKCEGAGPAPESRHGAYSVRSSRGLLRRFCAAPFIYAAPTLCWGGGGIEVGGVHRRRGSARRVAGGLGLGRGQLDGGEGTGGESSDRGGAAGRFPG